VCVVCVTGCMWCVRGVCMYECMCVVCDCEDLCVVCVIVRLCVWYVCEIKMCVHV